MPDVNAVVTDFVATGVSEAAGGADTVATSIERVGKAGESGSVGLDKFNQSMFDTQGAWTKDTEGANVNTSALERNAAAREADMAAADKQIGQQSAVMSRYMGVANKHLSGTQKTLSSIASMGTPAILKAATWGALGVGGIAFLGIDKYMKFQQTMMQSVTQAGVPLKELPFLSSAAVKISEQTGANLNDIAATIYRVASGTASWNKGLGATAQQISGLTRQVTNLNVIGNVPAGAPSEQSARVLTALANANMRDIKRDPTKAAALINAAVGAGDIRQAEMISAMGRGVLIAGKNIGASAKDVLGWIDLLTSFGTTGSVAGTYVRTGLTQLAAQSTQGTKAFGMIGIKPGELQKLVAGPGGVRAAAEFVNAHLAKWDPVKNFPKYQGKLGNAAAEALWQTWQINQFPTDIWNKWKAGGFNMSDPAAAKYVRELLFVKAFGGARQMIPMATLLNESPGGGGSNTFTGILNQITRHDTVANLNRAVSLAENTPAAKMRRDINTINAGLIAVGKELTPMFLKLLDGVKGFVQFLVDHQSVLKALVVGILGLIGVALTAKVAGFIESAYPMFGKMYQFRNMTMGRLFGSSSFDEELGRKVFTANGWGNTAFGQAFMGRGKSFLNAAQVAQGEAEAKLGAGLAMHTGALERVTVAEEGVASAIGGYTEMLATGRAGGMMAGGGSPLLMGERAGMSGAALSEREAVVMAAAKANGRPLSKTGIMKALRAAGFSTNSKEAIAIGESLSSRGLLGFGGAMTSGGVSAIDQHLLATATSDMPHPTFGGATTTPIFMSETRGLATAAEGAAVPLAENLGIRAGAAGLSELAGGALGILGGPVGMMAMMAATPFLMPLITKGIGGLLSLFKGSGPDHPSSATMAAITSLTTGAQTTSGLKARIAADRARRRALVAGGRANNAEDILAFLRAGGDIHGARHLSDALSTSKGTKAYYAHLEKVAYHSNLGAAIDAMNLPTSAGRAGAINHHAQQMMALRGISDPNVRAQAMHIFNTQGSVQAEMYLNQTRHGARIAVNDPLVARIIGNTHLYSMRQERRLSGHQSMLMDRMNATIMGQPHNAAFYRGLTPSHAVADVLALRSSAAHLAQMAKKDDLIAANKHLATDVRKAYHEESQKLHDRVQKLENTAKAIERHTHLDPSTIKDLARQIADANKSTYKELGMSATDYANAMSSVINANTLEQQVAVIAANTMARK